MWNEFTRATGVTAGYSAWAFGDTPDLADELARLVRDGPKRATAGLKEEYDSEPLPRAGEYSVILDGRGEAVCIIQTTEVTVTRFSDVDEAFAWDEGEGDRSLGWWQKAHIGFFARQGATIGDETEMVLERFDLVWPPEA